MTPCFRAKTNKRLAPLASLEIFRGFLIKLAFFLYLVRITLVKGQNVKGRVPFVSPVAVLKKKSCRNKTFGAILNFPYVKRFQKKNDRRNITLTMISEF